MNQELSTRNDQMLSLVRQNSFGELLKPLSREILLLESYIAGTSHISDESVFDDLQEGDRLELRREPGNRFDVNAIPVLDKKGRKLGYVPEKDNLILARLMDAGKYLVAGIDSIDEKDLYSSFRHIRISLYLVDY